MKSLSDSIADSRRLTFDLLLADIDLGLTFLNIAKSSGVKETVLRNQRNARKAYEAVACKLETASLDDAARQTAEGRLHALKQELDRQLETEAVSQTQSGDNEDHPPVNHT